MDIAARHKKEQRELVAQITAMKKQALKKTRKAVNAKCTQLQLDLDARHREELGLDNEVTPEQLLAAMSLDGGPQDPPSSDASEGTALPTKPLNDENSPGHAPDRQDSPTAGATEGTAATLGPGLAEAPKRRNRAKERLARRQAQIDEIKAKAAEEAESQVDYRAIEADTMQKMLEDKGLVLHEIKPDGHCLFSSVLDQLEQRHSREALSVGLLRKQAADYIRSHRDDFIPYLLDQETFSVRDVDSYAEELEHTAMWGSDMELAALSAIYECPIRVLAAGSSPIVFNEASPGTELTLAYFKHSYGLGEHYNSCRAV